MPTYAYRCRDCGHNFDIFQKFSEDSLTVCPSCEGSIRRVIQPTGVVFKGTGFYINDSKASSKADKDKTAAESSTADSVDTSDAKTDKTDKASDDKPSGDKPTTEGGTADKSKTGKAEPVAAKAKDRTPAAASASSK